MHRQWKMTKGEAQAVSQALLDCFHDRVRLAAIRALKITILNECERCID
jgi:hypothetical protein